MGGVFTRNGEIMAKKTTDAAKASNVVFAYKGFDKNMQCREFQFEVGKTYEHTGKVEACSSGFHSCANPFDVWNYYGLEDGNRFAKVTASGEISTDEEDSKIASAKISIDAELTIPAFIEAAVSWLWEACEIGVSAASGYSSKLAASGDYSQLAASGYSSKLAASGYSSQLAASGNSSKLAASGDYSQLAASGDYSQLAASGRYSIVMASGLNCTAKAGDKGTIALTRWDEDEQRYRVSVAYVGENGIKPDVLYRLDDSGNFVEA